MHRLLGVDNRFIGSQRDWPSAMKHQEQSGRGRQESQVVSIPHAMSVATVGRKRMRTRKNDRMRVMKRYELKSLISIPMH